MPELPASEIERVFREEYGRAVAVLARHFGDIDLAEEAIQDAFAIALERWPASGQPPSAAGWIITTGRNRAIDRLRREATRGQREDQAVQLQAADEPMEEGAVRDDRLRLIFTLLPPGARQRIAGCADAAAAGRSHHRRDRARISLPRDHHGATADPSEGEDPRRAHSLPHSRTGRTCRRG